MNKYLPFIDDTVLVAEVKKMFDDIETGSEIDEKKFFKNSIDPFSALFDAARQKIPLSLWIDLEKIRQGQKTLQNKLGDFHQSILGNCYGWKNLKTKNIIDVKNDGLKVIAEIKNKHNTTKGSDKVVIYDNLKFCLDNKFSGYVGYYVEIIPKNKKVYDKPFTPSDNKKKERREANPKIRIIDGKSFYSLATGYPEALKMLYQKLPDVFAEVLKIPMDQILKDSLFDSLFKSSFE